MPDESQNDADWELWGDIALSKRWAEAEAAMTPFFAGTPTLALRLPDLEERLAPILRDLNVPDVRISVVSVEDAIEPTHRMDARRAATYVDGLCNLLTGQVASPLGRMIDAAFRPRVLAHWHANACAKQVAGAVAKQLAEPDGTLPETRFACALRCLPMTLGVMVTYLALATAFRLEGEEVIVATAKLYADGNFPVGLQRDGAFVVLVK